MGVVCIVFFLFMMMRLLSDCVSYDSRNIVFIMIRSELL